MEYEITGNNCLLFYAESGDFLHKILSMLYVDECDFFYPTGSAAFFGNEFVQSNSGSDFDFLIKRSNWNLLLDRSFFVKNHEEDIKKFNYVMEKHYDGFLKGTDYNDTDRIETWNVLINYQNKLSNIIICQTDDVFRMWKFATVCMKKLCEVKKMKEILMKDKNERIRWFREFKYAFKCNYYKGMPF